jgi:hypothetical protein
MKNYEIVHDFKKFLHQTVGAKEKTRRQYIRYVQKFLKEKFNNVSEVELSKLRPIDMIQFMMNQKRCYKIPTLKAMTTA